MSWLSALKKTAVQGLHLERAVNEPLTVVRGGSGMALVLFFSLGVGTPELATSATMGAFNSGLSTFQSSFRPRPLLALVSAVGLGASTFVGYLASTQPAVFVLVLALWTFAAGMAWALGPTSGMIAAQTVASMLVVVSLPVSVLSAVDHALVILAAGLAQALLVLVWPIRTWGRQRDALADAFASVADYARRLREDPVAPFDPEPLMVARMASALNRPDSLRTRPAQLGGGRGPVERVRPVLAALADPRVGAPEFGPQRDRARALLDATARVLDALASAVRRARDPRVPDVVYSTLAPIDEDDEQDAHAAAAGNQPAPPPARGGTASITAGAGEGEAEEGPESEEASEAEEAPESEEAPLRGAARRAERRLVRLLGEAVDSVDRNSTEGNGTGGGTDRRSLLRRRPAPEYFPMAAHLLRRNLRWDSPVFRHAVRTASVAALGDATARALHWSHGYWAPLTAVMVMRPDFARTYGRGTARLVGTVAGVVVATVVVVLTRPGPWFCAGLVVVSLAGAFLTMRSGYLATSACTAAYVVFLLSMTGSEALLTGEQRVVMTLLGGGLALSAYAVFPTWETSRLADRLAAYLMACGEFAGTALDAFADPGRDHSRPVREALLDLRSAGAALAEAEARAQMEPVRARGVDIAQAARARSALNAMGRGTMLMEAHLPARDALPVPGAADFARTLREGTRRAADLVRNGRPIGDPVAEVRRAYRVWRRTFGPADEAHRLPGPDRIALEGAGFTVDALVDAAAALSR
ncbi:FUSC family protein [Phaeacidiphilus oryzae]|uniref:FUSC family protein n=1 Tax=Phaeacidiphilus oryzae TaxID=348818 RepID=UPI00068B6A12|nr:FUSC family protein [Phaeacidiphilus oryzae]